MTKPSTFNEPRGSAVLQKYLDEGGQRTEIVPVICFVDPNTFDIKASIKQCNTNRTYPPA